ncbi:hypothetical protein JCM19047_123 [Bacillus sp. JCM 19047]|nr:hypothetical protein JCM19047_123 [Bacillus sp. JCM 19047]
MVHWSSYTVQVFNECLAYGNKCRYCMAKGEPTKNVKEEDMEIATAFAELFLNDR